MNAECHAIAQRNRTEDDVAIVQLGNAQRGILRQRDVIADVEQVPSAAREVHTAMDMHSPADACAQRAKHHHLKLRPLKHPPRDGLDGLLHQPVPQVERPPYRSAHRRVASNERSLAKDGEHHGQWRPRDRQQHDRGQCQEDRRYQPHAIHDGGEYVEGADPQSQGRHDQRAQQRKDLQDGRARDGNAGAGFRRGAGRAGVARPRALGERSDGASLVDIAHVERAGQGVLPQSRDQLGGTQRIAAKRGEEVLGRARERGVAQHLPYRIGNGMLHGIGRRGVHPGG